MSEYSEYMTLPAPVPPRAPDMPSAVRTDTIAALIGRMEETLDIETAAVRSDPRFDINASNARKSRCLYELTRALRTYPEGRLPGEHRESIERLRGKLDANERTLKAHLSAVSEIATLLTETIQRSNADGTYSSAEFGWAR